MEKRVLANLIEVTTKSSDKGTIFKASDTFYIVCYVYIYRHIHGAVGFRLGLVCRRITRILCVI